MNEDANDDAAEEFPWANINTRYYYALLLFHIFKYIVAISKRDERSEPMPMNI